MMHETKKVHKERFIKKKDKLLKNLGLCAGVYAKDGKKRGNVSFY